MTRILLFALAWLCGLPAFAASPPAPAMPQSWIGVTPTPYGPLLIQQGLPPPYRDYQMNRVLTPEEKKRWLQRLSARGPPCGMSRRPLVRSRVSARPDWLRWC